MGRRFNSWLGNEDPTCHRATKASPQLLSLCSGAWAPQLDKAHVPQQTPTGAQTKNNKQSWIQCMKMTPNPELTPEWPWVDTRGQATQVTRTFPKALASAILGEGDVCVWGPMRRFSSHLSAHKHQGTASFSNKASKGQMVRDQGAATVSRKPVLTRGCLLCRESLALKTRVFNSRRRKWREVIFLKYISCFYL